MPVLRLAFFIFGEEITVKIKALIERFIYI
jgi:hypothetical protein